MIQCRICQGKAARAIGLCVECLRDISDAGSLVDLHINAREKYGLHPKPPKSRGGVVCTICANSCRIETDGCGYCGINRNERGQIASVVHEEALAYMYLDPLPTNCCAAWFCPGSDERGYNLAVFFYGCNFDCLFCQNASHKLLKDAQAVSLKEMVHAAMNPRVRCVCFFGGSPEPQLPFALRAAREIVQESENGKHICWEWNGCGNPALVREAAELSAVSGGTAKFDLKCSNPNLSLALCGVSNKRSFENLRMISEAGYGNILTATTLLVPYYVDAEEVRAIASFLAAIDSNIPYSLLVFHPDFYLDDLPITPREQVDECCEVARSYLQRVNIGNEHLLRFAE
jgi:pyruvate formate lyase activating enzyme